MPPSPPPPPTDSLRRAAREQPDPTLIQVDPDSASMEHLLQTFDAAADAARAVQRPLSGPMRGPHDTASSAPLASYDDLAANTLALRHALRRHREADQDVHDGLERNGREFLDSLGLTYIFDPHAPSNDDLEPGDDDGALGEGRPAFGYSAAGFDADDASDDEMHDGWAEAGHEDDFHLVGFDGDIFDIDDGSEGQSEDDERVGDAWATPRPSRHADSIFRSVWPGYAGERPLNAAPEVVLSDAVSVSESMFPQLARDPSSAMSYSSFFRPGATFVGEQTFNSRTGPRSRSRPGASQLGSSASSSTWATTAFDLALEHYTTELDLRTGATEDVSTAHPAFSPHAAFSTHPALSPHLHGEVGQQTEPASTSGSLRNNPPPPWRAVASSTWQGAFGPSSSLAIPRPAATSAGGPSGSVGGTNVSPRAETNPLLAILRGRSSPSSRYAPYSASSSGAPVQAPIATHPAAAAPTASAMSAASNSGPNTMARPSASASTLSLDAAARARARVAQSVNPSARSSRSSWGEVGEELLLRVVERERERERERVNTGSGKDRVGSGDERWSVKVTILSYEPELKSLTGLMRAYGVAIPPPSTAPISTTEDSNPASSRGAGDVTTFFSGSILHPILDGLFCSPSPTGSGGEFRVTRASEAESWVQLGPFKGMTKGELLEHAKSRAWVEERTRGWVLCRWKERDFINVTAKESSLSISGFYHVVLNRQTGEVEGLYHDPAATPHQRLVLSPADNDRGAFGVGSFAYR